MVHILKSKLVRNGKKDRLHKLKLIPKIIHKGGLIPLAAALVLSGCAKEVNETGDNMHDKIINMGKEQGMEIVFPEYETEIPFVRQRYVNEFGADTLYCNGIEEFKREVGITTSPSHEDVIEAFKNNKTIPDDYLKMIVKNIENMKEKMPDLDLSALYCNAKRMKFVPINSEGASNYLKNSETPAAFNILTGEVYYNPQNKELDEFSIIHEVLGHGSIECLYEKEDKKVYTGFYSDLLVAKSDGEKLYYTPYSVGIMYTEGAADMIARTITGQTQLSIYNFAEEELRIISSLTDSSISELINSRGIGFYERMKKCNIDEPVIYIMQTDNIYRDYSTGKMAAGGNAIRNIYEGLVIDAAEEDITNNGDKNIKGYIDILTDTYFDEGVELYYYADQTKTSKQIIEEYNPDKSAERIETVLKQFVKQDLER